MEAARVSIIREERGKYLILNEKQELMRSRWAEKRWMTDEKGKRLVAADYVEQSEFDKLTQRKDLVCKVCKSASVTVDKLTGEIKTCKACAMRNVHLKKKYGLTRAAYDVMWRKQRGRCAICVETMDYKSAYVDHCHEMNHVRGLLCRDCNFLIGAAKDDENVLMNAAKYCKFNRLEGGWYARTTEQE